MAINIRKDYSILLPNAPELPILLFDYSKPGADNQRAVTLAQVKDAVFRAVLQGHTVTLDTYETDVVGAVIHIIHKDAMREAKADFILVKPHEDTP